MTAETLELIEVAVDAIARPTSTLILADRSFITTLRQAEVSTAGLVAPGGIKDGVTSQAAADLLGRLTKAGKTLDDQRLSLKRPFLDLMAQIDSAAKMPQATIERLKKELSAAQSRWAQEQRRIQEEAEKARLAELARLEALRLAEEKAAQEKAAKIAADLKAKAEADAAAVEAARIAGLPPPVAEEVWEEEIIEPEPIQKTEIEKQIEAVRHAPVVAQVKASGVREVVTLYPHVVDINKVPDCFVTKTIKLSAVQSTFCRAWKDGDSIPECSGIRFEVQRSTQSTGRAGF